jgi:HEAT repeat protein
VGAAVDPAEIVAKLQAPTEDRRPLMRELRERAPTGALVGALADAGSPFTRQLLADLLGERGDAVAAEPLAAALGDPDEGVRAAAADALGKVFMADEPPGPEVAQRVGGAMLDRFETEPSAAVRRTLASAVGAARYEPAIPALRAALRSDDRSLAYAAGWGLHWLEGTPPPKLPASP